MRQAKPGPRSARPRASLAAPVLDALPPVGPAQPVERLGPAPQDRHQRPEEDRVVEPQRTPSEPDERLELGDRPGQGREAQRDRPDEERETPQPAPRRQDGE